MPVTEQTLKETKKNPARVLRGMKGNCTRKGQRVGAELDALKQNESISQEEATELKTLLNELNEQRTEKRIKFSNESSFLLIYFRFRSVAYNLLILIEKPGKVGGKLVV